MANQITGKILLINPTRQIPSRDGSKTFQKREMVIDATRFDPYTGERSFENTPLLEFSGERCAELDQYKPGQIVTISFDLQGTKYVDKDGNTKYFTNVRAYKIEAKRTYQQPQQQAQQPAPQPMQQPSNTYGRQPYQQYEAQQGNMFPPSNDMPF